MLTFVFHCIIKNIRGTSSFVGKVSYTNSFVYVVSRDQLHKSSTENPLSTWTICQTIEGLNMASDILIFLLKQLRFMTNLKKLVEFLGLETESVNMNLNLPMEKVRSLTWKWRNLMENPKPTLWEIRSLIGSLCSTAQAVMPTFLKIRYLQQQQVEYTKSSFLTTQ